MPEPIVSLEKIEAQAKAAAQIYDHIDLACPYSFYTAAGRAFKAAFQKERMAIAKAANKTEEKPS